LKATARTVILVGLAALATVNMARAAQPKSETYSCEYFDLQKNVMLTGLCHKEATKINGHFAYILTWPSGNKVSVEYINSQSGNHIWRLNGEAAVGIEITRDHLKGFMLDLNQLLEWEDRDCTNWTTAAFKGDYRIEARERCSYGSALM
jgi:hypothetical protein